MRWRRGADAARGHDATANDVDGDDLAARRIRDVRVPPVGMRRRIARLGEAAHDVDDLERRARG